MAAGMPAWVARTVDFLTHPLGLPSQASSVQSQKSHRAMLAQSRSPSKIRNGAERRRNRSGRFKSQAHTSRSSADISDLGRHTAAQTSLPPESYESRSTQTEGSPTLKVQRLHPEDGTSTFPTQKSPPEVAQESVTLPGTSGRSPSEGPADGQMDVDGRATPSEVDDPQEQETVSEDLEMPDSPPYTDGEAQVVLANDGVKVCLALLLTNEMIAKINQIGTRYRRLELITSTLKGVKREIKSDENILEYKYDALRDTDDQAQLERIKEEMDEIQRRIATATEDAEALEDEIGTLTINLAASRYRCQEILEGTLGRMDLLDIPEPELAREMDPADKPEYVREPAAGDIAASRSCFYDHDEAITQEKLAESIRQAARADLESKREVLITIDEAFEHRQENVAEEKEEYRQRVREGTCSITETEFDLLTLDDFRRMTADLRDAQEAFEESFRKAKQLGALDERDAHYQESVFSNGSQGYPPSTENAMVGSAPTKSITYWRAGVEQSLEGRPGEGTELESSADVKPEAQELEDCDLSSVAISDSWSCVDWSRNRRRIDEWRAIAGRER